MLEKSLGILFYLKKPKQYTSGPMPVYLRITVDGIPKELTTKRECEPDRWNADAQRAKGTKEDVKSLNAVLDSFELKVHDARRKLMDSNTPITSAALKNTLLGVEEKPRMLLEIFQQHNDQLKELIGKDFTAATLERYKTSLEHTRSFLRWKYNLLDIDIKKLDFEFISEYEFWLKSFRACNHNTTMKYLSNFRKIVNRAVRCGWVAGDPFAGFKMGKKEVVRDILSETELQTIATKNFGTERLNQVRDIFLFCCFSGLSYADVKKLKKSEIGIGVDGEKWIFTNRQKTSTASRIPLLPTSLEILERYSLHPQCVNQDRILPVPSNQKMNAYLKEIVDICGISKKLTFHIARHTFATTVTLSNGVPIETVSKMLGHVNLRTTQIYAKVLDRKVSEDMAALRQKLAAL